MQILMVVWSGLSSFVALVGLAVAIMSFRHSQHVQQQALNFNNLDQRIELAITRSLGSLEGKLETTFVNAKNLALQLQVFETKLQGFEHRVHRNSTNVTAIGRTLMQMGALSTKDFADDETR